MPRQISAAELVRPGATFSNVAGGGSTISTGARRITEADLAPAGPGLGRAFAQDIPVGVGNIGSLADMVGTALLQTIGVANPTPDLMETTFRIAADAVANAIGIPTGSARVEPVSRGEEFAAAAGRGVGETLPTLPLAAAAVPARLAQGVGVARSSLPVIGELASGVGGEVAATAAEDAGLGSKGQVAAGVLGSLAPGAIARGAAAGVRRIAAETLPAARRPVARRAAAEVIGAPISDRAEAIERLAREADAPFGRATTAQALEDVAPGIRDVEIQQARRIPDVGREVFAIRRESLAEGAEEFQKLFPAGAADDAVQGYRQAYDAIQTEASRAFKGVGDVQNIPTGALRQSWDEVVGESTKATEKFLPKEYLDLIDGYGDATSLSELQGFYSRISNDLLEHEAKGTAKGVQARWLRKVRDGIEKTLDTAAEAGNAEDVNALRKARSLRRFQGDVFERKAELRAFLTADDMQKSFRGIMNAKNPLESLALLKKGIGDNPEALAGLQRLMRDHIFGTDFELLFHVGTDADVAATSLGRAIPQARRALSSETTRKAFDLLYGEGSAANARKFVDRLAQVTSGKVGTTATAAPTGIQVGRELYGLAAAYESGGLRGATVHALKKAGMVSPTNREIDAYVSRALVDPDFARGLLEEIPPKAVPMWADKVRKRLGVPARSVSGAGGEK